jgi:hypothetical protein
VISAERGPGPLRREHEADVDELQKFQSDLDGLLNDLIAQSQRNVNALSGMRAFLCWYADMQTEADRMMSHFAVPRQPLHEEDVAPPPLPEEHVDPVDLRGPEHMIRLREALTRQGD